MKPVSKTVRWLIAVMVSILFVPQTRADEGSIIRRVLRRLRGERIVETPTDLRRPPQPNIGLRRPDADTPSASLGATSCQLIPIRILDEDNSTVAASATVSAIDSEPATDTDREVAEFVEIAVASHPALRQAQASIEAALGRQWQTCLYPNPTIGYSSSEIGNDGRAGQQGFIMTQEIVRGQKRQLSYQVAESERDLATMQAEIQLWRIRNTVHQLYFEALASQEIERLMGELESIAEKAEEIARQRERAGEGTLADVLQTQIELSQVRLQASNAAHTNRAVWKRLGAAIGRTELEPRILHGNLDFRPNERDELAALAQAIDQSPEMRLAEAGIRRAEAAAARARAEPTGNLTVDATTQYDFATRSTIVGVGLGMPIPVYNRNQGNIAAADADVRRSRHEVDRVRLSIADRYATAYAQFRNALDQVERYGTRLPTTQIEEILAARGAERQQSLDRNSQIVPRAQLALALATEGWQRGEFNYLQVLTAQRSLTQVRLGSVRALAELRQSVIALDGYLLTDSQGTTSPAPSAGAP
jgi:cobalt-zinc-cadmium efflux system outer membrane protein